jgi:transcriptional antiterminator RfaH
MMRWCVAHTQPVKESMAQQHLEIQGFTVYLPRFKKTRRHARKVEEIAAPLFPGYLFIGFDLELSPWRSIHGTRGVSYLLLNNNRPSCVPTELILELKAQEDAEGLLPLKSLIAFHKGDKLRILEGSFQDQTASFEKWNDRHRVQVLLHFLGRELSLSLPSYAIESA